MKFGIAAAAALGMLLMSGPSASANDGASLPGAISTTYESSMVVTQGRRGGGAFRGGGGGGFRAAGGGGRGYYAPRRGNVGRNVAIGVGAAVIGGIIANQAYRSSGNSCGRWNYLCNNGEGWACRNVYRYC